MITTEIAFQWVAVALFLLPAVGPYRFPTFYDDRMRKDPDNPDSYKKGAKNGGYWVPAPGIFEPIWWVVGFATGAVFVLYWQNPSLLHPDRADAVFGLLLSVPFLQLFVCYLFFKPISFVGAAVFSWIIVLVFGCVWWFITWSGITTTAIMIILVIPSLWAICAAVYTTYFAWKFGITEVQYHVTRKHIALERLLQAEIARMPEGPPQQGRNKTFNAEAQSGSYVNLRNYQ